MLDVIRQIIKTLFQSILVGSARLNPPYISIYQSRSRIWKSNKLKPYYLIRYRHFAM